jgi:hypothetical protein
VACYYEHSNELSGYIRGSIFFDQQSVYHHLKKESALMN